MNEKLSEARLPENRKPWKRSWGYNSSQGGVPNLPKVPWGYDSECAGAMRLFLDLGVFL